MPCWSCKNSVIFEIMNIVMSIILTDDIHYILTSDTGVQKIYIQNKNKIGILLLTKYLTCFNHINFIKKDPNIVHVHL